MSTHSEITEQILSAWDEAVEEEEAEPAETEVEVPAGDEPATEETEAPEETEEEVEQPAEEEPAEAGEEEAEESEEPAEGEEEEPEVEAISDDPAVQAFLAKYQGNVPQALAAATNLEKALGNQGLRMGALGQRIQELEAELAQANVLQSGQTFLSGEQQAWVEEATVSAEPQAYVRQAINEGEYALARAVCDEWAKEAPYEAIRARQVVDASEQQAYAQYAASQQQQVLPPEILMDVLVQNFPDMPTYEQQMVSTLGALGDNHPIVVDSRSPDPQIAARGIVGLYEIARAASVSVNGAREQVKRQQREAGNGVRAAAVVSSSQASPSSGETPRGQTRLMPGLTLEQLDEAFEKYQ